MPEQKTQKKSKQYWYYIGGGVIIVVGYLYLRNRQQSAAVASGTAGLPNAMPVGASSSLTGGATQPIDLQQWMQQVQAWANSIGFDAGVVQTSLQEYSTGHCVSKAGFRVLDQALALFGQPPQAPFQGLVKCSADLKPPTGRRVGGGFLPQRGKTQVQSGGFTYSLVEDSNTAMTLHGKGIQLWFEPAAGIFAPITRAIVEGFNNKHSPFVNTPVYVRQQSF